LAPGALRLPDFRMGRGRSTASPQVLPPDARRPRPSEQHVPRVPGINKQNRAPDEGRRETPMKLTDSGESRIRGYLYVFERSLRSFLSPAVATDAVREVESHIRDAVAEAGDGPDEHAPVGGFPRRRGPPMRVAQAYSLELVMDEAAATGRLTSVLRSLFHAATTGGVAFFAGFGFFGGSPLG